MDQLLRSFHLLQTVVNEHNHDLLSGDSKLSLDSSLICRIKQLSEEGPESDCFAEKEKTDIKSLINVLNNVQKLKISQRSIHSNTGLLDIESFRSLKFLELCKISVDRISGLNSLKSQLEALICIRCLNHVDVLNDDSIWNDLKILVFSHSKIVDIGINQFKNCPWLKHLDLSYNNIKNVIGLQSLDNLRYVDLSFNCLEAIPIFSQQGCKNLQILLISHNYITSLKGVKHFSNLRGLDASYNCILDRFAIKDLSYLMFLQWVNLSNNPLCFNQYYRLYAVNYIGTRISPQQFVLDNLALSLVEQTLLSAYKNSKNMRETDSIHQHAHSHGSGEIQGTRPKKLSGRKISKVREVIIEEVVEDPHKTSVKVLPEVEKEEEKLESKKLELLRKIWKDKWLLGPSGSHVQDLMGLTKSDLPANYDISHYDIFTSSLLFSQSNGRTIESSSPETSGKSPLTSTVNKLEAVAEDKPEIETTVVTVHACENNELSKEEGKMADNKLTEEHCEVDSFENNCEQMSDVASEELFVSATEEQIDDENGSDKNDEEHATGNEALWIVQKINRTNTKAENIFLVLLDSELRERDPSSGRILAKWALDTVQSCVKVKSNPVTLEVEFDTVIKDKQSRLYEMEFADAQILLKRLNEILEARPLSFMNHAAYKCIKCSCLFTNVKSTQVTHISKNKDVVCPVCNSNFLIEIEEPRLPGNQVPQERSMSNSPSQSSIGSAVSLDQSIKSVKHSNEVLTPRRCESDIEIISNPSQSSIEVLDDQTRMQGANTPGRKRSSEERQAIVAVPQLRTVPEVQMSGIGLTESSSSGSMTESVITSYEAQTTMNKKIIHEGSLLEETNEESPKQTTSDTLAAIEENQLVSGPFKNDNFSTAEKTDLIVTKKVIYSYTDFSDIDDRIQTFLNEAVFESEQEKLACLIRCHLWKSGGADFQACIVLSTESLYILSIKSSNHGSDASEWLSVEDTYRLKELKSIFPLVWFQGVGLQVKNIFYLLFLQDRERTENLFKFLQGLSIKMCKIQKNPNAKIESQLQTLAESTSIYHLTEDPSICLFTICSSISIFKDEDFQDTMRLVGLLITTGELHIILGDLAWLTGTSSVKPSIHYSQMISCLIQIERNDLKLKLCFLNESENVEEVWSLHLATDAEVSAVIKAIQIPWEKFFSVSLQVTTICKN